jgi:hypothetical protein
MGEMRFIHSWVWCDNLSERESFEDLKEKEESY